MILQLGLSNAPQNATGGAKAAGPARLPTVEPTADPAGMLDFEALVDALTPLSPGATESEQEIAEPQLGTGVQPAGNPLPPTGNPLPFQPAERAAIHTCNAPATPLPERFAAEPDAQPKGAEVDTPPRLLPTMPRPTIEAAAPVEPDEVAMPDKQPVPRAPQVGILPRVMTPEMRASLGRAAETLLERAGRAPDRSPQPAQPMPVELSPAGTVRTQVTADVQSIQSPAPPAASPATISAPIPATPVSANPTFVPQDLQAVVERLAEAREIAQPGRASLAVRHEDFGAVSVRLEAAAGAMKFALSSADPDFAPSVQVALIERAAAAERPAIERLERAPLAEANAGQSNDQDQRAETQARQSSAQDRTNYRREDEGAASEQGAQSPEHRAAGRDDGALYA